MRGWLALVLLAGCGRLRFDATGGDAATSGDASSDACTFGSFGAPRNIVELNRPTSEYGPWLSDDKLSLYFSSQVAGPSRLYHATRDTTADPFGTAVLVSVVAGGSADDPFVSADGLQMVFDASPSTVSADQDVNIVQRASTAVEFGMGAVIGNINRPNVSDTAPSMTADSLTMAFGSTRNDSGDLFLTTRPTDFAAFTAPVPITTLNTPGFECCPSLAPDGKSMLYVSNAGTQHILRAVRDATGTFMPAGELDPVLDAPTGQNVDESLTSDGTTIVFVSNRNGGVGGYDMYIAERSCL